MHKKFHIAAYLLLCLSLIWPAIKYHQPEHASVINSDGLGYYSYLPALFIYNDASWVFLKDYEKNYRPIGNFIREAPNGSKVNQYFVGEAVLISPFFAVAHVTANVADGFSAPYQRAVLWSTLFYVCVALYLLTLLVETYTTHRYGALLISAAILHGTNLYTYAVTEPSFSHAYSFFAITLFLFAIQRWAKIKSKRYLFTAAVALGFIVIIRPSNLLVLVAVPFFLPHLIQQLKETAFSVLLAAVSSCAAVVLIQPLCWHWQTGLWIVDAYTTATFNFSSPELFNVLVSFKKGWWVYTPLAALSLGGFYALFKVFGWRSIWLLAYVFLNLYVISSWSVWHYGSCFGQRAFVESYAVLAVLLGVWFNFLKQFSGKVVLAAMVLLCVGLNQMQARQYSIGIIHPQKMDRELYFATFLKKGSKYRNLVQEELKHCAELKICKPLFSDTNCKTLLIKEVEINTTPACIKVEGNFTCSNKNTDAYLCVQLLHDDKVLRTERVYFFKFSRRGVESSQMRHQFMLNNQVISTNAIRYFVVDVEQEISLDALHVELCSN